MRVLHVIAGNLGEGAALGAYGLHRGLLALGVDSHVVNNGQTILSDPTVTPLATNAPKRFFYRALPHAGKLRTLKYPDRPEPFHTGEEGLAVQRLPGYQNADVIHLHWINGLVRLSSLKTVDKPVVWTLRDMWPFTGGCHYSLGCDRYRQGCGACPQLKSTNLKDLSQAIIATKSLALPRRLQLVGISDWISDAARQASLFKDLPITTIPNGVDLTPFEGVDRKAARRALKLEAHERVLLVGALRLTDPVKGFDLFLEALRHFQKESPEPVTVLTFGHTQPEVPSTPGVRWQHLGFLQGEALAQAYGGADAFVAPARQEAFGKTVVEALAVGTPVVAFEGTGPATIIEHKLSGFLAKAFDAQALTQGLAWALEGPERGGEPVQRAARVRAKDFSQERAAARYQALYQNLIA